MEKRYRFASAQRGKSQRLGCGCRLFRQSRSDGIPMHRPSDRCPGFPLWSYPRHQQHRRVSRHRPRPRPDAAEGHYRQDNL